MQLVDTAQKNGHGDRVWIDSTGINAAGYATTVWMDDDNTQAEELQYGTAIPDLMAAGTDGTNMIIAQLGTFNSGSGNYPQPDPNFAPDHVGEFPGRGILVVPTAGASTVATSISEFDDRGEQYIIGGTTYYGCGSGQTSDFTLLKIDDSGDVDTSFGNNPMTVAGENYNQYTLNFEQYTNSQCKPVSDDACFSTVVWQYTTTNPADRLYYVDAVGTSDVNGGYQFAYAQMLIHDDVTGAGGTLNTAFGDNGVAFGPSGSAHAAVPYEGFDSKYKDDWGSQDASGGRIYVAGDDGAGKFEIASIGEWGTDSSFSQSTVDFAPTNSGSSIDNATSIGWKTDGTIVAGGYTQVDGSNDYQIALADYQANNYVNITSTGMSPNEAMSLASSTAPSTSSSTSTDAGSSSTSVDSASTLLDATSSNPKKQQTSA